MGDPEVIDCTVVANVTLLMLLLATNKIKIPNAEAVVTSSTNDLPFIYNQFTLNKI